jgi:hypothetical protein
MSAPGKSLPLFCPFLVLTPPRSQTYVVISPYTLPAIEMVLHLREECEVQFPEIRFHEDEGAEMPGPEWIQSLVTHSLASGILREDLEVFYSRDRKKQVRSEDGTWSASRAFLVAVITDLYLRISCFAVPPRYPSPYGGPSRENSYGI